MKESQRSPDGVSFSWRPALFVLIVSGIAWLGGTNIRTLIGSDLLESGTADILEYIAPDAEREIYRLLSMTALVTMVSYFIVLVSAALFLTRCPWKLKENGWLLMSAILLYALVPVELFTMYLDARMVYLEFFTTESNNAFRELFLARVGALAGAPFVALFCYYTIVALVVFQPFKRTSDPTP
ncbi:MAG: hypothetical protein KAJ12_05370 [Bacteroidetes bacterium]|nr:hypothetical protein [Bacteroidota bacterium]